MNEVIAVQAEERQMTEILKWCYTRLGPRGIQWDCDTPGTIKAGPVLQFFFEDPRQVTLLQLTWSGRAVWIDSLESLITNWQQLLSTVEDNVVLTTIDSINTTYMTSMKRKLKERYPLPLND